MNEVVEEVEVDELLTKMDEKLKLWRVTRREYYAHTSAERDPRRQQIMKLIDEEITKIFVDYYRKKFDEKEKEYDDLIDSILSDKEGKLKWKCHDRSEWLENRIKNTRINEEIDSVSTLTE